MLLRFGSVLELSLLSRPIAAPGVRPFVPKSSDDIESWVLCELVCFVRACKDVVSFARVWFYRLQPRVDRWDRFRTVWGPV